MLLRIRLLVFTAVLAIAFGLTTASALAAAPSATGGGTTAILSFGFTAQSHSNGSVSGNAEFQFPSSNISLHVRINCLVIVGEDAYMSGTTTEQTDGLAKGTEILFGVRDNDATGLPDMISDVFFSPGPTPLTCQTFHATPHYTLTSGNVEVRSS